MAAEADFLQTATGKRGPAPLSDHARRPRPAPPGLAPSSEEKRPGPRPGPRPDTRPDPLAALYARPGFKLRRAHQAALSVFAEECRAFDVTTTQYGILVALHEVPGQDQIGLAQGLGLDRSTTGMVVSLLEQRELLRRERHAQDARRRVLTLTPAGEALLRAIGPAAERARQRLLEPLSEAEAAALAALLDRLLAHHDALVRVPLRRGGA